MRPIYKKGWFKAVTGLIVLCLLFISFLPYGIRYGIQQWYLQQGADNATVADVDLNLFTGVLVIKQLQASKQQRQLLTLDKVTLDFDWLPLLDRQILFRQISIDGFKSTIHVLKNGDIVAAGVQLPGRQRDNDQAAQKPWGVGLHNININDLQLRIRTPDQDLGLVFDKVELDRLETWSGEDTHLSLSGSINNAEVSTDTTLRPFAEQALYQGKIRIQGLDISPLAAQLQDQLQELGGRLDIETAFIVRHDAATGTRIDSDNRISLGNLLIKQSERQISLDRFSWQGKFKTALSGTQKLTRYSLDGSAITENTAVSIDKQYRYHHDNLEWSGSVNSAQPVTAIPKVKGKLRVTGITLQQQPGNFELFHSGHVDIEELSVDSMTHISSQRIELGDLRALTMQAPAAQKGSSLLTATSLQIDNIDYNDGKQVNVGNTQLGGALITIERRRDGQINQFVPLQTDRTTKDKSPSPATTATTATPLDFIISRFSVGKNSRIKITDASVKPAFKTEMTINQAEISQIDSGEPAQASPFLLDARLDKYSSVRVDGEILPFSSPLTLKANGRINRVNLPPLSSYTAGMIGYDLLSGQLNAVIKADIVKGKLDIDNKLTLSNLEVKSSDAAKSEKLTAQLSMPLNSALSLLRDKHNDIKLDIPVTGDINKPDFDISNVINKAIGTAMKQASMTYLTQALQPYGSLITLAKLAKTAADYVSLNPILFEAASTEADKDALGYSAKIGALMKERPKLRIKLCGIATGTDLDALVTAQQETWKKQQKQAAPGSDVKPPVFTVSDETLLELALRRSIVIKDILINEHGIDPARLFECQPAIERDKESKPRVDLRI